MTLPKDPESSTVKPVKKDKRKNIIKSEKLLGVCYDIRGPVLEHANRLEEEGHRILKLNIGNPAPFGFEAPDEIITDVVYNIREAQGYTASDRKSVV